MMKTPGWRGILLVGCTLFGALMAGCKADNTDIPKSAFKRGEMPPDAQKGMAESMKRAGRPDQTAH